MKYFLLSSSTLIFLLLLTTRLKAQMVKTEQHISWKVAATIPPPPGAAQQFGLAGAWAGINNDVLLIAGGANFPDGMPWLGGKKKYYSDVYAFRKKDGSLTAIKNSFQLPFPIAYGASCTTPQGIICAGGENESGLSNKVILLKWNKKENNIVIKDLPKLPFAVSNASITATENRVYLAGGEIKEGGVSTSFLSIDLNDIASGWKELPSLPKPVSHSVLVVQSAGKDLFVYLIGGRKRTASGISELYSSVFAYDVKKEKWEEKSSLPHVLSAGTGVSFGNNKILLFGGDKGETFHKTELLIAAINAEKDATKKEALNQQKIGLQTTHPGFSKEVLQYNTLTNDWNVIDTIPFAVPVTTTAVKCGKNVFITSGEIKAGVRTPQVLEGKMKKVK